jgi:hypothetical protein
MARKAGSKTSGMAYPEITPELLREAARLRFIEGKSWEDTAAAVGTTARTLYNWRHKDGPWQEIAEEIVAELKSQSRQTAYGCLVRQANLGDVAAAKELLNRAEGAVGQKHEIAGSVQLTQLPIPVFSATDPLNHFADTEDDDDPEEGGGDCDSDDE